MIKFAARADLHHLGLFLQGRIADAPQEALQVLDIVLRELPTSRYKNVYTICIYDMATYIHGRYMCKLICPT